MPSIPLYNFTPSATPQSNVRAPGDMFAGVAQAGRNLGAGIASLADPIAGFAMKAQRHVDEGNLAAEETERLKVAADIEAIPQDPKFRDTPEKWADEVGKRISAYDTARAARVKNYRREVQEKDTLNANEYWTRVKVQMGALSRTAAIVKANGAKETNANARMLQGDYEGAFEVVRTMDLTEEQKAAKVQQLANSGLYQEYDRKLSDTTELPPAQARVAAADIEKELVGDGGVIRDGEGNVVAGLSQDARNNLLRQSRARQKAAEAELARNTSRLFAVFDATGSPDEFNTQASAAQAAGMIDGELFIGKDEATGAWTFRGSSVGDFKSVAMETAQQEAGVSLRIAQAREGKVEDAAAKKAREAMLKQMETAQKLVPDAQAGRLSVEQINRRVKDGDLNEAQGAELRRVVERVAANDLNLGNKLVLAANAKDATGKPLRDVRGAIMDYRIAADLAKRDVAEIAAYGAKKLDDVTAGERQAWLASVNAMPISLEAKATLMRDYLDAYQVDLVGFDVKKRRIDPATVGMWGVPAGEERTERVTHLDGRELTPAEVEARSMIAKAWKMAPGLGEAWSGELLLAQERRLTEFFTGDDFKDDEASKKAAGKLAADLAREVADVSAQRLLEQSIPLGILAR